MSHIEIASMQPDMRPSFVLEDVTNATFFRIQTSQSAGVPVFALRQVDGFRVAFSQGVPDTQWAQVTDKTL